MSQPGTTPMWFNFATAGIGGTAAWAVVHPFNTGIDEFVIFSFYQLACLIDCIYSECKNESTHDVWIQSCWGEISWILFIFGKKHERERSNESI